MMKTPLQLKSNKLFYKKYPYKVETRCRNINYAWRLGKANLILYATSDLPFSDFQGRWNLVSHYRSMIDDDLLKKYLRKMLPYIENPNIKKRNEGSYISYFFEDKELFKEFQKAAKHWLCSVTEPENPEFFDKIASSRHNTKLCKELPFGKYRYKIVLRYNVDHTTKANFLSWINKYEGKVRPSPSTKNWLKAEKNVYIQDPYVYLADDSMLSLSGLFLGNGIRRIDEYVVG